MKKLYPLLSVDIQETVTISFTVEPLEGDVMVVSGGEVSFLSSHERINNKPMIKLNTDNFFIS